MKRTKNLSTIYNPCDTPNLASKKACERLNMKEVEEKEINGNRITSGLKISNQNR
ncbi:MAG: hypothetical protein WKF97_07850 [Chitinophagaceae bacterium]